MERITAKQLQAKVDYLNKILGRPAAPYTRNGDKYIANPGNIHIDGAYGGWCLDVMETPGGGVSRLYGMDTGHVSRRALYERLCAFIGGIETVKEGQ